MASFDAYSASGAGNNAIQNQKETLDLRFEAFSSESNQKFNSCESKHGSDSNSAISNFDAKRDEGRFQKMYGLLFSGENLNNECDFKINGKNPLWLQDLD